MLIVCLKQPIALSVSAAGVNSNQQHNKTLLWRQCGSLLTVRIYSHREKVKNSNKVHPEGTRVSEPYLTTSHACSPEDEPSECKWLLAPLSGQMYHFNLSYSQILQQRSHTVRHGEKCFQCESWGRHVLTSDKHVKNNRRLNHVWRNEPSLVYFCFYFTDDLWL